jgi:hypothetical protein
MAQPQAPQLAGRAPTARRPVSGLGIAALVLGIVACLIGWIPFLGLIGILLAIIGLALGIAGIVGARGGRKGLGLPVAGTVISGLLIVVIAVVQIWIVLALRREMGDWATDMWQEIKGEAEQELPQGVVQVLAQQQVADRLSLKVEGYTPMSIKEEKRLKDAHDLYERYSSTSTKLHEIVWAFKEALAYGGRTFFKNPADDRLYAAVLARWIEVVEQKYRQACILEKNKDWIQAEKEFNELLAVIGDDKNPVFANVKDHYSRVKWYREKKAPSKRRPWE